MKPFDQKARRFQIITKNAQLSFSVQSGLWGLSEYVGLRRKRRTDTLLDSRHSFQLFRPCHSCYFFDKSLFLGRSRIVSDTKLLANIEKQVCVRNVFLCGH